MSDLVKTDRLEQEVEPVVFNAQALGVQNAEQYQGAGDFLKECKTAQKKVITFFSPLKKKTHEAWKAVCAEENRVMGPLKDAEQVVKGKMLSYQREQEFIRQEEERRLQAEADAAARKERERLLKEAEKLKTPELKEARLAEAESVVAPVVTVQAEVPKVAGISTRTTWKAKVVNKTALLTAALSNPNLLAYITVDEKALNRIAQATKGQVSYPGVEFYQEQSMASGGK